MIPKTNSYHLSLKGMIYLLFKKKRCPLCKGKLIKTTEKEYTGIEKNMYELLDMPRIMMFIYFMIVIYVIQGILWKN